MLETLKQTVCQANLELPRRGLVTYTWGNVSAIDRAAGLVAIKPSGVAYDGMKPEDMVIVDLSGRVVEGGRKPSSDLRTHLELYKHCSALGGIVHNAVVLEEIAKMAAHTLAINPDSLPAPGYLIEKHYSRKHGPDAYYGQN